jgi:hypothetical protein
MSDKWYKTRWSPMIGGRDRNIPAMGEDSRDGEYVRFDEAFAEIARLRSELANARNAALEEAAEILEMRAANYERISCDVWLTKEQKRSYAAMEEPFMDAASAIRSLKSSPCGNNVDESP